jgi:hypothetical protein
LIFFYIGWNRLTANSIILTNIFIPIPAVPSISLPAELLSRLGTTFIKFHRGKPGATATAYGEEINIAGFAVPAETIERSKAKARSSKSSHNLYRFFDLSLR